VPVGHAGRANRGDEESATAQLSGSGQGTLRFARITGTIWLCEAGRTIPTETSCSRSSLANRNSLSRRSGSRCTICKAFSPAAAAGAGRRGKDIRPRSVSEPIDELLRSDNESTHAAERLAERPTRAALRLSHRPVRTVPSVVAKNTGAWASSTSNMALKFCANATSFRSARNRLPSKTKIL